MAVKLEKSKIRESLRRSILEHAGRMLLEEGVHGISMRKLSKQLGTSTMVLYNCFENKQDILNELYLQGYEQLKRRLEEVPKTDDPKDYLIALGWAYRRAALANVPAYFLMQSRSVPGFTVPEESLRKSRESFVVLESAIKACIDAGLMVPGSPKETAQILWATIHGVISLQLFGHFETEAEGEARFQQAMKMMQDGLGFPQEKESP